MCVTTAIGTSTIIRSTAWAQPRGGRRRYRDMRSPRCAVRGGTRARAVPALHPSGARTGEQRLDSRLSSHTPTVVIGAWHPAAHSTTRARPRPRWSSSTNSMASRPYKLPPAAALSPSPNQSSSFNTCTSLTYVRFLDSLSHELAKPSDQLIVSHPTRRQDIGHGPLVCPRLMLATLLRPMLRPGLAYAWLLLLGLLTLGLFDLSALLLLQRRFERPVVDRPARTLRAARGCAIVLLRRRRRCAAARGALRLCFHHGQTVGLPGVLKLEGSL